MIAESGDKAIGQSGVPGDEPYSSQRESPIRDGRGFLLAENDAAEQSPHCRSLVASNGVIRRTVTRRLARSAASV